MFTTYKANSRQFKTACRLLMGVVLGGLLSSLPARSASLDIVGPPPVGDPSVLTGPFIGSPFADTNLLALPEANGGAFAGGKTGTATDARVNGSVPQGALQNNGAFDVPTGSRPSPLFGARPFTQRMLLFEEFGPEKLDPSAPSPANAFPAPSADPADPSADGVALEAFLAQSGIGPFPTEMANTKAQNPWKSAIEAFLGRSLTNPPAEGRPPGQGFAHQRWNEFYPQTFFKTAMAGARVNGGFRDSKQRHG